MTLPGSRYDVEIPYNWAAENVNVGDYGDELRYTGEGGGGANIYSFSSCADAFKAFSDFHGGATSSSYGSDWLPSGWSGVADTGNTDHLLCHDLADSHSLSIRDSNDTNTNTAWRDIVLSFISSMSSGWYAHGQAYFDEVVTLYGSKLTTALPGSMLLSSSDPTAGKDVLTYLSATGSAAYSVFRRSDACTQAVNAVAPAQAKEAGASTSTGWTDYTLSGIAMNAHCYAGSATVVVLSPTDDALRAAGGYGTETGSLLADIADELASPPSLGDVQTLPVSGWKLAVPYGWDVSSFDLNAYQDDYGWGDDDDSTGSAASKVDMIEASTGTGGPKILKPAGGCDSVLTGTTYDPAWMPDGWRATSSYATVTYCTSVDGGPIEVDVDMYGLTTRLQVVAILDSLRSQNTPQPVYTADTTTYTDPTVTPGTPATPETPYVPTASHGLRPILPWPLELSLQTMTLGENGRGWGGRVGLGLDKALGERIDVELRGELGYDSQYKVSYDVASRLLLRLTRGLSGVGTFGRDQIGTGDTTQIGGSWYYGVGGSYGTYAEHGGIFLEVAYDWRVVPASAAMPMPMDPLYPGHEWRFKGELFWPSEGRITGLTTEFRTAGDAHTFLAGVKFRL